jgi:two-component system LytT family response regulator/two-component system response regulator LytT
VVFVSGSSDYALAAFQIHAADYLLKPIEAKRVEEAVRHLEQRLNERRAARAVPDGERSGDRLPVRDRRRDVARLLARREIIAVLRRGRRTWVHTADGEYPSYYPVARMAAWLGGAPFLRTAREAIVNTEAIAEIIHYGDRLYQLRLKDRPGTVIAVSRSGARRLASLLKPPL